jgi:hypothetical protein
MASVTINASGDAPPDEAWDRYKHPARWPDWAPQITGVEADSEELAAGVRGKVFGPLGVSARFIVDAVDERRRAWSWTVRRWPVTLKLQHGVQPHEGGSRTWLTVEGPLPLVIGYVPLAHLALRRLVAR